MNENQLSHEIIGAALDVHKALGPGLLESAYEECLAREFSLREIPFLRQVPLPVSYKGLAVEAGYRLDFLIAGLVVVELKAVESLLPIHEAQVLTYLKLSEKKLGMLINFNTIKLRDGIKRVVMNLKDSSFAPFAPFAVKYMPHRVLLCLGANVGEREDYLRGAIARLSSAPGVNFLRQSRVYQTAPVGVAEQRPFLNMVIEIEAADEITPRALLALTKQLEVDLGRQRRGRWGPREIDIDILLFGDKQVQEDDLHIPHPEMWERAFVLVPLADLEPDMKTPSGETAAEAAARMKEEQGVHAYLQL
jgi:2-amino-4-hydroxy-6-hydroxymethyldihydropteridine diphosphokinase